METYFDPIENSDVKLFFNEFFHDDGIFFEIISNFISLGFYGIKSITEKVCEISVYFNEKGRWKITKNIALKCLNFPFLLGFDKVLIRTELEKMRRFLSKMYKHGVIYLFQHNRTHWFEVKNEF